MNLFELNELINYLVAENDPENETLIAFYTKKRTELVDQIHEEMAQHIYNDLIL